MAFEQLTFDFRYTVDAFCMGTKRMVTLDHPFREPHPYKAMGVSGKDIKTYGLPQTCPECRRILEAYNADMDRMREIIEGPSRHVAMPTVVKPVYRTAARPRVVKPVYSPKPAPAVEEVPAGIIEDVVARMQREELACAASGEA